MSGTVLYRKWRPADFDEVVGQEMVVRTLRNAVSQDKIAHAYLFCGPRGTGKTTTARILARAINGRTASTGSALGVDDDLGFDLVEIDAASNRGIDDIRELRERANYQPGSARFKVYLIDEVHQLTGAAADALLKTLEEPPPHVVFILATTDPEALKPTILSRCQRFDFRRVSVEDMVSRLRAIAESEGIAIPDEALRLISREATGSLRDGVNLLDQVWVMCGSEVSLEAAQEALGLSPDARAMELASAALHAKLAEGLAVISAVQEDAIDFGRFKRQVVTHLRHALLSLTGAAGTLSLSAPEEERLAEVCAGVEPPAAVTALKAFSEADVRRDPYQPLPLELALASIVYGPAETVAAAPAPPAREQRSQRRSSRQGQSGQQQRQQRQQRQQPQPRVQAPAREAPPTSESAVGEPPPPARRPSSAPPRPQQQPVAAAESSSSNDLLERLQAALRNRNQGLVASMLHRRCAVVEQDEQTVLIGFPEQLGAGHIKRVSEEVEHLSAAASEVFGRRVRVQCVAAESIAHSSQPPPQPAPQPPPTGSQAQQAPQGSQNGAPPSPSQGGGSGAIGREARRRFGARPYPPN